VVEASTPQLEQWNPTAAGLPLALDSRTMVCLEREVGPTLAPHSSLKTMSKTRLPLREGKQATATQRTKTAAVENQEALIKVCPA
jgi:hypothetical protein